MSKPVIAQTRHHVLTCPSSTLVGYVGDGKSIPTQSHIEEGRSKHDV